MRVKAIVQDVGFRVKGLAHRIQVLLVLKFG